MTKYEWRFTCIDNGGKHQSFIVKASNKDEAIRKGFEKAEKNSAGNIYAGSWNCKLVLK